MKSQTIYIAGKTKILFQGRNHGIDIGGVQMWALPQIFFFKFSRGSERKNKQARPSTNE